MAQDFYKTIRKGNNTKGDGLALQLELNTGEYRILGEKINYVRGRNIKRWVLVKGGLDEQQAIKLFEKKLAGKRAA